MSALLTPEEAGAQLDVDPAVLRAWAYQDRITHLRVGRRVRFTPEHVEQLRDWRPRAHVRPWSTRVEVPAGPCSGVYFITGGGLVKIGVVARTRWDSRITTLQVGSPVPLTLHRFVATKHPELLEAILHRRYARHRSHGEWFDAAVLEEIDKWSDEELLRGQQSSPSESPIHATHTQERPADAP